jgi:hypothetical protein
MNIEWKPIETFDRPDYERVDVWCNVWASPLSMGLSDSFRVIDAYRLDGKWYDNKGLLASRYITHWSPILPPPVVEVKE